LINIDRWYHLIGFALFGIGIYFFVLYLMREFKKDDFDLFMEVLNIKKMVRYIKDEIKK
jgi:hypothetical protein